MGARQGLVERVEGLARGARSRLDREKEETRRRQRKRVRLALVRKQGCRHLQPGPLIRNARLLDQPSHWLLILRGWRSDSVG